MEQQKSRGKRKGTKEKTPKTKALTRPLTESEKQLFDAFNERHKRAEESLPAFKENTPTTSGLIGDEDTAVSWEKICSLLKTDHRELAGMAISTTATTGLLSIVPDIALKQTLQQFASLQPQSYLETMLIAQMIQVNNAVTRCMMLAFQENQSTKGREMYMHFATKFQRTFVSQIEALQKLRGKGGQKVTVEHVHVHQGGQAIVGNVEKGGGGK
ncbi:MAG: hypothetical protein RBR16_06630 [Syntrophus sp. (in: bacteria)]|nr:hypothetical protein [Syntrophus sp. (in: bacteria)]